MIIRCFFGNKKNVERFYNSGKEKSTCDDEFNLNVSIEELSSRKREVNASSSEKASLDKDPHNDFFSPELFPNEILDHTVESGVQSEAPMSISGSPHLINDSSSNYEKMSRLENLKKELAHLEEKKESLLSRKAVHLVRMPAISVVDHGEQESIQKEIDRVKKLINPDISY